MRGWVRKCQRPCLTPRLPATFLGTLFPPQVSHSSLTGDSLVQTRLGQSHPLPSLLVCAPSAVKAQLPREDILFCLERLDSWVQAAGMVLGFLICKRR